MCVRVCVKNSVCVYQNVRMYVCVCVCDSTVQMCVSCDLCTVLAGLLDLFNHISIESWHSKGKF